MKAALAWTMKHANEITLKGPASPKLREWDKTKNDARSTPVTSFVSNGVEASSTVAAGSSDKDRIRLQMHLRYTTLLAFTPWPRGGLNE